LTNFRLPKRNVRKKNLPSLRTLALQTIQSKKYPKLVLRIAYTSFVFHTALKEWQEKAPLKCPMMVEGVHEIIPFWFSYPEESEASGY
jgi:hypothetical protein